MTHRRISILSLMKTGLVMIQLMAAALAVSAQPRPNALQGWNFKLKDFVIGAWLGPDDTDAELKIYREAGFNVVMVGRYMSEGRYALPEDVARQLDLARKHGLMAMIDTYTENGKPWGGLGTASDEPSHHNASPAEFEWLYRRFGKHPALAGFCLGDDQGSLSPTLLQNTAFLHRNAPHLFPWVCGWVSGENLVKGGNPIMNPQMYPTLYNSGEPASRQAQMYCDQLENLRASCQQYGLIAWPMFNVMNIESDSLTRFQVYSSIAYGAQGIWYFTYRGNGLTTGPEGKKGGDTEAEVRQTLKPIYRDARTANLRAAAWGRKLMGSDAVQVFHTGWQPRGASQPGPGHLIESMSDGLLAGVLTKGKQTLVMVVDKRVDKPYGAVGDRDVEVRFADSVKSIDILEGRKKQAVKGSLLRLHLPGGGGQLLAVRIQK
ncbi:MAG: hypothetical protein IT210_20180 [Armatimonadetes bacterium]|nr:hypothetical protein [Armatimonadota bacterium]